ncbi:MAG: WD40 repeat domain-containing protein, partial [Planctomycetota bacterium]|nr:WD40 repeat domain-containing protein [Planctomycetota bacterium]
MAIVVECEHCGKKYRIGEDRAGMTLSCKDCGGDIEVPFDNEEEEFGGGTTSRRRQKTSGGKNRRKKEDSSLPVVKYAIGGIATLVGLIVGVMLVSGKKEVQPLAAPVVVNPPPAEIGRAPNVPDPVLPAGGVEVAQNDTLPAEVMPNAANANDTPLAQKTPEPATTPESGFNPAPNTPTPNNPTPTEPPKTSPPGDTPKSGFQTVPGGDANNLTGGQPTLIGEWKVEVDAPQYELHVNAAPAKWKTKLPQGVPNLLYPIHFSDFIAIGSNNLERDVREIWNVRTGKKAGEITGIRLFSQQQALSPDGRYFAGLASPPQKAILVWDVEQKKPLGQLELGAESKPVRWLKFAGVNRLIVATFNEPLMMWKIPSGELEPRIELIQHITENSVTYSPGGKYQALADAVTKVIVITDLDSGETAAQIQIPKAGSVPLQCDGLAFSPDGTELAGFFTGIKESQLMSWDLHNGKLLVQQIYEENLQQSVATAHSHKGNRLEWFPDKSKWLLYGSVILDRTIPAPIWSSPENREFGALHTGRVVSNDQILTATGDLKKPMALAITELPAETLAQASALIQKGGRAIDAQLPPLIEVDLAAANDLRPGNAGNWQGVNDVIETPPLDGGKAYEFTASSLPVQRLELTRASGRALIALGVTDTFRPVGLSPPNIPSFQEYLKDRRQQRNKRNTSREKETDNAGATEDDPSGTGGDRTLTELQLIDLAKGTLIQTTSLAFKGGLIGVSPAGKTAATRLLQGHDRIDLWNVETGKHVAGFRPYHQEEYPENFTPNQYNMSMNPQVIRRLEFIDDAHLLTVSTQGRLVCWTIPECRPLYVCDGVTALGVSPTGRFWSAQVDGTLVVVEARSGQVTGEIALTDRLNSLAFDPAGGRLLAHLSEVGGDSVALVDLQNGSITERFPIPLYASEASWVEGDYILLNHTTLFDVKRGVVAWTYQLPKGMHADESVAGRHWYLSPKKLGSAAWVVASAKLPDAEVQKKIANAAPELLVEPGGKIGVVLDVMPSPQNPNLSADVGRSLSTKLAAHQIEIAENQPVTLHVKAMHRNTNQTRQYRMLGPNRGGQPQNIDVAGQQIEIGITVEHNGETVLGYSELVDNTGFHIEFIPAGQSVEDYLNQKMWVTLEQTLKGFVPPKYIFPAGAQFGRGHSQLTPG